MPKNRPTLTIYEALSAAKARLDGDFDNPAITKFGPLSDHITDVREILTTCPELLSKSEPIRPTADASPVPSRAYVDISTGHVSEATARWLNEQGEIAAEHYRAPDVFPNVDLAAHCHGWLIYCDDEPENLDCPDDLKVLMRWVKSKGFDFVNLDCDAEVIDGLPSFDW